MADKHHDEGTSDHYLPAAEFSHTAPALLEADDAVDALEVIVAAAKAVHPSLANRA